jgi:hypothetical protein
MTSLQTEVKQNHGDSGYFINVGDIRSAILGYLPTAGSPTFSTAGWTSGAATGLDRSFVQSSLGLAGGALLKDMGKTVVSSLRTFRKVQFVYPGAGANSSFGVAGSAATNNVDYFTGYIELGFEGYGTPARVAKFGR